MSFYINLNATNKTVNIADIKITKCFRKTIPADSKIAKRVREYRKTGEFANTIILNQDGFLIDGYTQYLVCKMLDIPTVKAVIIKCNPKCKKSNHAKNDIATTNTTETLKAQIFKDLAAKLDLIPVEAEYWLYQAVSLNHVKNIIINEISNMIDRPINFRLPESSNIVFGDVEALYNDLLDYQTFIIYHDEHVPNKHNSYIDSGAHYKAVRLLENDELFFSVNENVDKDDFYLCITGKILSAEKFKNVGNSCVEYVIDISEREKPFRVLACDKQGDKQ